MRLRDLLKENKQVPAIFSGATADPNRNGAIMDPSDTKVFQNAQLAVIHALAERLAALEEDAMPEDDGSVTMDEEAINEDISDFEDHEGQMAKAELFSIYKKAGELYNMIGENEELEGWVQSKITKAAEFINSVHNTLSYEKAKPASVGSGMGAPADTMNTDMGMNESTHMNSEKMLTEKSPKGWEATVLKMKKHKEIDNPWALAHWMKGKGYKSRAKKSK